MLGRRGWAGSAWWGHLLAGAGGGESVGLGAGVDDVGVEGEPVDDGGGQSGVGEGVAPLAERGVRSAGDGGSFLAGGDDLEEQLILADVGGEVAVRLVDKLRDRVHEKGLKTGEEAADALRDIIAEEMTPDAEMDLSGKPAVILVIGVNGVGKTTSIAKLADHYTREGKKVMLAAGDTFRAAASEQLEIWADRAGVPIVSAGEGADPAAVIFDTVKSATARGYDMVIADTAGRLHNKANLMAELSKISRSVKKASPEASLETLLVLDAITGQNAISQAKEFCKAADATGIILTKLDGTAKGGCVVAVKQRLGLPVRFIGVGEGIDDLLPFTPEGFVEELLPRQWKH